MTRQQRFHKAKGFTLIELLLVLVIIGMATSLTVISLGRGFGSDNIERFSKQFRNMLGYVSEEAVLFSQQIGLLVDIENLDDEQRYSYRFFVYNDEKSRWVPAESAELKKGLFPEKTELEIEVDGEELIIGGKRESQYFSIRDDEEDEEKKDAAKEKIVPDIIFFSSGETQQFRITMKLQDQENKPYVISATILGQIDLKLPGEGDD